MSEKTDKPVLTPGPDHPISVTPAGQVVTVRQHGRVIARTDSALVLTESTYPPVYYLPLAAVDADVLRPTDHATYCPYKGDASYYSLVDGDSVVENAVWSYVEPYESVSSIAGHLAFYPQHVEITSG
jgi:uncharacterized protein (DUF427 family)